MYWDEPYFLVPDGALALEAYGVIREAMKETDRIALGRVVMHTRERLLAIEPRDEGLLAYTLRSAAEVKSPVEAFDEVPNTKPDAQMVEIARQIIDQQSDPFEPSLFTDRYEEALKSLIAEKEKGGGREAAVEAPEDTNVIDLMAALKKSLGQTAPPPPHRMGRAAGKKTQARKTAS
jgi:DNA end-binding protein Ku